jgi:hypothetical protein
VCVGTGPAIEQLFHEGDSSLERGRPEHALRGRKVFRSQVCLHGLHRSQERGAETPARRLHHDAPAVGQPQTMDAQHAADEELVARDRRSERPGAEHFHARGDRLRIAGSEDVLLGLSRSLPVCVERGDRRPVRRHEPSIEDHTPCANADGRERAAGRAKQAPERAGSESLRNPKAGSREAFVYAARSALMK